MARHSAPSRPYLREADRRRQLLDATLRLVERSGIEAVTMSAVAREAGVSRRLVYDHFADLAALFEAFLDDRVQRYGVMVESTIGSVDDPVARAVAMFTQVSTLPREELRLARTLVTGTGAAELDRARERFRRHVISRWFGDDDAARNDAAAATVWAMAAAVLTIADLVARGELAADTGVRIVGTLVAGSVARTDVT